MPSTILSAAPVAARPADHLRRAIAGHQQIAAKVDADVAAAFTRREQAAAAAAALERG